MKMNSPLRMTIVVASMVSLSVECQAQQAPGYRYSQAPTYPQQDYSPQNYPRQGYTQQPQSQPQQGDAQPGLTEYLNPMQFLPTFGRKFGSMFRRIFYGDAPPQGYSLPQPQQGGHLDQPPNASAQAYEVAPSAAQPGYAPRYQTAPVPRSTTPAMPPTSRMNSGSAKSPPAMKKSPSAPNSKNSSSSTSKRKYTPPSITREAPKVEEEPDKTNTSSKPYQLPSAKPAATASSGSSNDNTNAAASSGNFLRGKKSSKEGRVISPYPPYRELDVSGLSSGSLALDPTTQKVFEVP